MIYFKSCTKVFSLTGRGCMQWKGSVRLGVADSGNSTPEWKQSGSSGFHAGAKRRCRHRAAHQRCFDHLLPTRPFPRANIPT